MKAAASRPLLVISRAYDGNLATLDNDQMTALLAPSQRNR